jgi:hypothetical protein
VGRKQKQAKNKSGGVEVKVETRTVNSEVIGQEYGRDRRANLCLNLQFRRIFDSTTAWFREKAFSEKQEKIDICLSLLNKQVAQYSEVDEIGFNPVSTGSPSQTALGKVIPE